MWNVYIKKSKWFFTLAIFIFVINLTNIFCKTHYLQWFKLTLSSFLIKMH